jgi:hypothetical protein
MPRDPLSLQSGYHRQFLEIFRSIGRHHGRYERFADFLELATCAIRKTTVPPGPEAEAFEERYMKVVARYPPEDIRTMPKLLALTQLAVAPGGCDFLGTLASELELLDAKLGQLITPYPLSRLLAEVTLQDPAPIIAERGFITLQEPSSGAGGMVLAAADVLEAKGTDPRSALYVEALDVSSLCFKMTYLQLALRGIPAIVRHTNTLSLEIFESAHAGLPPIPSPARRSVPAVAAGGASSRAHSAFSWSPGRPLPEYRTRAASTPPESAQEA